MNLNNAIIRSIILITCCVISACGWHLRGLDKGSRPEALALIVENRFEPLVLVTRDVMQQNGIAINSATTLQLHIGKEHLRRRTVAVTSIGSASQYELILSVEYRYQQLGQAAMPSRTISTKRVFDFDPTNTVAKNEEENTLLDEMRHELAIRLLDNVPVELTTKPPAAT